MTNVESNGFGEGNDMDDDLDDGSDSSDSDSDEEDDGEELVDMPLKTAMGMAVMAEVLQASGCCAAHCMAACPCIPC